MRGCFVSVTVQHLEAEGIKRYTVHIPRLISHPLTASRVCVPGKQRRMRKALMHSRLHLELELAHPGKSSPKDITASSGPVQNLLQEHLQDLQRPNLPHSLFWACQWW